MTWKRWLVVGIAGVLVLVVGLPWLYVSVISGDEPEPLSLSSPAARADPDAPVEGAWTVASGSVVGYRVEEILFGQNNTAVGRTNDIEGEIRVDGTSVTAGKVTVDMTTVRSDQDRRDNQFHGRIMETSRFPTATFEFTDPVDVGSVPENGVQVDETVAGELTLHGVTNTVQVDVEGRRSGSQIQVRGAIPIVFADYGIEDPSFGPAETEDNGLLEFALVFERA